MAKKVLKTGKYTTPVSDSLRTVRTECLLGHLSIDSSVKINCQEPKIFLRIPIYLN